MTPSLPASGSLNSVNLTANKHVTHEDTSPRESSCEKITQLFFDSPRRTGSDKKRQVKDETKSPPSDKIQTIVEHSPLASSKVKKIPRSKSLHSVTFQQNALYTPPKPDKNIYKNESVEKLPVCKDIFSETIINTEWLRKLDRHILQGTLRMPHSRAQLQEIWKEKLQTGIDDYYRRYYGFPFLSQEILQRPPEISLEHLLKEVSIEEIIFSAYQDILTKTSITVDEIALRLRERTELIDNLRQFLRHVLLKVRTWSTFLTNLKKISSQKELYRVLSMILVNETNPHTDMVKYFESFKADGEAIQETCLREIRWFHNQARHITFKQVFQWTQNHTDQDSLLNIDQPQIVRSITTYGKRVIDLKINGVDAEHTLEEIIDQINQAGIDKQATKEMSIQQAREFEKSIIHRSACESILRLLSMGCWFHADQLIRKWFDELYEVPLHTRCKKGILAEVDIQDSRSYQVRQIKTFGVYCRRIPNDPECFTVMEPEIGEITFQWQVSPDSDLGWKGELRVLSWKIRNEAPNHLKWLFVKALTHYHS